MIGPSCHPVLAGQRRERLEHEGSNRTEKATPGSLTTAPTLCGLKGPRAAERSKDCSWATTST